MHYNTEPNLSPMGYEKIDDLDTEQTLTRPSGATRALIKTETENVRWRDDGTSPTSALGMLLEVGDELWYSGNLRTLEFIEVTAGAVLHISYYA